MSLTVAALITRLEYRLGWPDDAAHRAKCLDFLNDAERRIAVRGSWLYLRRRQPLALTNTSSSVPAPASPAMDPGKQATISDDIGKLSYLPPDEFPGIPGSDFYAIRTTRPMSWTFSADNATPPVATIFFDRANTTGSTITYTIDFQRAVVDLADTGSSYSLLPDGYEIAYLLEEAEAIAMQMLRRIGWDKKRELLENSMIEFFTSQRSSKESPMTDTELQERGKMNQLDKE